jgi:rhamnosyltransferase
MRHRWNVAIFVLWSEMLRFNSPTDPQRQGSVNLAPPSHFGRDRLIYASILIPTKNGAADLPSCLEAIFSQKEVGLIEVVVVDSGSTDATLEIVRSYPVRIEQIPPETFHHARTRNFAADLASGEFLVFLSQDAIPSSPAWLSALLDNFQDSSVGAVYGRQLAKKGAQPERHQVFAMLYGDARLLKRPGDEAKLGYKHYHFSSVNAAIRRSVWKTNRFPDELRVFEDVGIATRILQSGWSIVYEPRAAVYHSHDFASGALFKRYFDIGVVYQRLGIWSRRSRQSLRRDGWQMLRQKFNRRRTTGQGPSVLEAIGKYVAIELGRRERFLPLALKKRLSQNHLFDD